MSTYHPYVMMLLPTFGSSGSTECMKHYVVLEGVESPGEGWDMLPTLAADRGFTRLPIGAHGRGGWSNLYERDGKRYVGYWTSTDVAASDVWLYAPSAYLPTCQYRRWKILVALRILRAASFPMDRLHVWGPRPKVGA